MTDEVQMDPDFSRWIRSITIDPNDPKFQARATAVRALADDPDVDPELLLRVAVGQGRLVAKKEQVERIEASLKAADPTFEPSESSTELKTLVGAALATAMRSGLDDDKGSIYALATVAVLFDGERSEKLDVDLMAIAQERLLQASEVSRRRPELASFTQADSMKGDYEKAAAAMKAATEITAGMNSVTAALDILRRGHLSMAQKQAQAYRAFEQFLRIQDEELQILWWLVGEFSEAAGVPVSQLPAAKRIFLLPCDIAAFVKTPTEPPSLIGLLGRAGIKPDQKFTVPNVVNALDNGEVEDILKDLKSSAFLAPLHFALERRLETGAGADWVANWAAATGLKAEKKFDGLALAMQAFRERQALTFAG